MHNRTLPQPGTPEAPNYWMNETGGDLAPAVQRYLLGEELTIRDLALLRAYLRQWVESPAWDQNPHMGADDRLVLAALRTNTRNARSKAEIDRCISLATDLGMDPL